MRALLTDSTAPRGLRLGEHADPEPLPHQTLIRVTAAALNYGEVATVAGALQPGSGIERPADGLVPGFDAAGYVVGEAADGSGPEAGTPVVCFGPGGGWAERRAVATDSLGVLPAGADVVAASAIPVAGLTALRALQRANVGLESTVLITGASGGVGGFAIQLAKIAGAHVIASTSNVGRHEKTLRALGADDVVAGPEFVAGPVDAVLDMVGGQQLVVAYRKLAQHGTLVAVGHSAEVGESFAYGDLFGDDGRHNRSIVSFHLTGCVDLGPALTWLAGKVHDGSIDPHVTWQRSWRDVDDAVDALLGRRLNGKAVITID
jgi:NADPH:quinone reductase-like Zn-dependent oxidoreductase